MYPILEINLNNLLNNYIKLNKLFPNFWAMLKDNAYGLGIEKVALTLYKAGCRKFMVVDIPEALSIKKVLLFKKIEIAILNGFFNREEAEICVKKKFIPFISNKKQIDIWKELGGKKDFAIFLETGLNRMSLREEDIKYFLENIAGDIRLAISHLACARNANHPKNMQQKKEFDRLCKIITIDRKIKEKSLCSSEGVANLGKNFLYDSVRLGSCLYGFSKDINQKFALNNIITFKSPIIKTMFVKKGTCIGYGDNNILEKDMKLAVLNVGLANGLYRSMAHSGAFFGYKGKRKYKLPIVSGITMEYTIVDITTLPSLKEGDYIYLFDYQIHIKDSMDNFNYEDIIHRINSSNVLPYHKEFFLSLQHNKNKVVYTEPFNKETVKV